MKPPFCVQLDQILTVRGDVNIDGVNIREQLLFFSRATAEPPRSLRLSPKESSILDQCQQILGVHQKIDMLANIALLVVCEAKLYREIGTLEEYAATFGFRKQTLYRRIDIARINLWFCLHGLHACIPRGRKLENLALLPIEHWIPCWDFVLRSCDGKLSDAKADILMAAYARKHDLPYKGISPCLEIQTEPITPTLLLPGPEAVTIPPEPREEKSEKAVTSQFDAAAEKGLPKVLKADLKKAYPKSKPGQVVRAALKWRLNAHPPHPKAESMAKLLEALRASDPKLHARLERRALQLLHQHMCATLHYFVRKEMNQREKTPQP